MPLNVVVPLVTFVVPAPVILSLNVFVPLRFIVPAFATSVVFVSNTTFLIFNVPAFVTAVVNP